MEIKSQNQAEIFLNNYFRENTSINNIIELANNFKKSNINKSKNKLSNNYKKFKKNYNENLQVSLKKLKRNKPTLVINFTGFPKAKNININKPEKKEEALKYLYKLHKKVNSIWRTVWTKCYKNKTNIYSKWFCEKKEKLEIIKNKIEDIIRKLENMSYAPKSTYSEKQINKLINTCKELYNLDNKTPNLDKLFKLLLSTDYTKKEKQYLIVGYLIIPEVVLSENIFIENKLISLKNCLLFNSQC